MKLVNIILYENEIFGIKRIEIPNRLLKGYYIQEKKIGKLEKYDLEDVNGSGVYFLLNKDNDCLSVYIGQAVNLNKRIEQHKKDQNKNFQYSILFTTKGEILTETEINYLERKLIEKTIFCGKVKIENKNGGNTCLINKYNKVLIDEMIDEICILVGCLGYDFLENDNEFIKVEKKEIDIFENKFKFENGKNKIYGEYVLDRKNGIDGFLFFEGCEFINKEKLNLNNVELKNGKYIVNKGYFDNNCELLKKYFDLSMFFNEKNINLIKYIEEIKKSDKNNEKIELYYSSGLKEGKGLYIGNGVLVFEGSEINEKKEKFEKVEGYRIRIEKNRKKLFDGGIIGYKNGKLVFLKNYFDNGSNLGGVISGNSTNGNIFWKNKDGKNLKELK